MSQFDSSEVRRGTISKCPSCGAQLAAFVSACSACGHEFMDVDANRSIAAMVARFDDIERDPSLQQMRSGAREQAIVERKARVIRDFPIPNSREDLQQLLFFIQPKLLPSVKPDPNVEDWRAKFNEVLGRARFAYKDDKGTLAEFDRLEQALAVDVATDLKIKAKRNPVFVILLVGVLVIAIAGAWIQQREKAAVVACENKYDEAAQKERARLDGLAQIATAQLKERKFGDALASAEAMRWELADAACKASDNQNQVKVWAEKRSQLSAQIQREQTTAVAQAEAAASQAEAAERAEAEKVAQQLRLQQEAEAKKAAQEATEARKLKNDKSW